MPSKKKGKKARQVELKFKKPRKVKPLKETKRQPYPEHVYSERQVRDTIQHIPLKQLREYIMGGGVPIQYQTTQKSLHLESLERRKTEEREKEEKQIKNLGEVMKSQMEAQLNQERNTIVQMDQKASMIESTLNDIKKKQTQSQWGQRKQTVDIDNLEDLLEDKIESIHKTISGKEAALMEMLGIHASVPLGEQQSFTGSSKMQESAGPSKMQSMAGSSKMQESAGPSKMQSMAGSSKMTTSLFKTFGGPTSFSLLGPSSAYLKRLQLHSESHDVPLHVKQPPEQKSTMEDIDEPEEDQAYEPEEDQADVEAWDKILSGKYIPFQEAFPSKPEKGKEKEEALPSKPKKGKEKEAIEPLTKREIIKHHSETLKLGIEAHYDNPPEAGVKRVKKDLALRKAKEELISHLESNPSIKSSDFEGIIERASISQIGKKKGKGKSKAGKS